MNVDSVTSLNYAMKVQRLLNKTLTTCMQAVPAPTRLEQEERKSEAILVCIETLGRGEERKGGGREKEKRLYSFGGDGSDAQLVKHTCEDPGSAVLTEMLNWECVFNFSTQEVKAGGCPRTNWLARLTISMCFGLNQESLLQ